MLKQLLFSLFLLSFLLLAACSERQPASEETHPEERSQGVVSNFSDAKEALEAGKKYLDENKIEEAIELFKQATKLDPDLAEAYFQLGIALSLKENEEGIKADLSSPSKNQKFKRGEPIILTEADKAFEMAVKAYKKLTEKDPENADAFFNLGRAYSKIRMDEEAEEALKRAVKLNPNDIDYQTELGATLIRLAKYDEAIKVLKKALELDENNLRAADLLEKAKAGKKRIEFALKPTPSLIRPLEVAEEGATPESSEAENPEELTSESNSDKQNPRLQPLSNDQPTIKKP